MANTPGHFLENLHTAIIHDDVDALLEILDSEELEKCDLNAEMDTETGYRALHFACERGSDIICRVLVEHGARLDVKAKTEDGSTPMDLANPRLKGVLRATSEIRTLYKTIEIDLLKQEN